MNGAPMSPLATADADTVQTRRDVQCANAVFDGVSSNRPRDLKSWAGFSRALSLLPTKKPEDPCTRQCACGRARGEARPARPHNSRPGGGRSRPDTRRSRGAKLAIAPPAAGLPHAIFPNLDPEFQNISRQNLDQTTNPGDRTS